MTGIDLISASLRLIGVLASGEQPSATEANNALTSLNDMIDMWSTQNLTIPAKVQETFALIAGQQTYTMGAGGGFNTSRPQRIENALIQIPTSTPALNIPMRIINQDEWAAITLPLMQSTFPTLLYSDNNYPLTNVNVWPIPTAACSVVLFSWKALAEVALLTTAISFPPGYQEAIKYNLASRLAPEYGKQASPDIVDLAVNGLAHIKRMNVKPVFARVDAALRASPAVYDWRSDGYSQ